MTGDVAILRIESNSTDTVISIFASAATIVKYALANMEAIAFM
jgi:hypothetical protein